MPSLIAARDTPKRRKPRPAAAPRGAPKNSNPRPAAAPRAARHDPNEIRRVFDELSDSTLLTLQEVASVLGISAHTIKANRRDGHGLEAVKLGRSVRYPVRGVRKIMAAGRQA